MAATKEDFPGKVDNNRYELQLLSLELLINIVIDQQYSLVLFRWCKYVCCYMRWAGRLVLSIYHLYSHIVISA